MTLTQARKTLERFKELRSALMTASSAEPPELDEAIDMAISVLPVESKRPTAAERLDYMRACIRDAKDGFDPFASRTRGKRHVAYRQCVWMLLQAEGYGASEIARSTGFDHATVWWGTQRLREYLERGDYYARAVWEDFKVVMNL